MTERVVPDCGLAEAEVWVTTDAAGTRGALVLGLHLARPDGTEERLLVVVSAEQAAWLAATLDDFVVKLGKVTRDGGQG